MISVIVPVYNVEKYLEQCIDSIMNQTYKDFEIILVDDGSTDTSGKICDVYCEKFKNIHVVHKENEGLGYARNSGIDKAHGDYIVFIDSDDYVEKNMLQDLYNGIQEYGCDTCLGGHNRVNLEGEFISSKPYEKVLFKDKNVLKEFIPRIIGSAAEKSDSVSMSSCNVLYSMDIIKKNNLRFVSERDLISEDLIFNMDYFRYSKGILLIESCNYNYRINTNSLTTKYRKDRFESVKKLYLVEVEKLKELGIYDTTKDRLMKQFFIYLRMCFNQENTKISNLSFMTGVANIRKICTDKFVQSIINQYPINRLGIPQKVFIFLVKHEFSLLLYVCVKLKLI